MSYRNEIFFPLSIIFSGAKISHHKRSTLLFRKPCCKQHGATRRQQIQKNQNTFKTHLKYLKKLLTSHSYIFVEKSFCKRRSPRTSVAVCHFDHESHEWGADGPFPWGQAKVLLVPVQRKIFAEAHQIGRWIDAENIKSRRTRAWRDHWANWMSTSAFHDLFPRRFRNCRGTSHERELYEPGFLGGRGGWRWCMDVLGRDQADCKSDI